MAKNQKQLPNDQKIKNSCQMIKKLKKNPNSICRQVIKSVDYKHIRCFAKATPELPKGQLFQNVFLKSSFGPKYQQKF